VKSVRFLTRLAVATTLLVSPLQAQVVGGPATDENCFPFGCLYAGNPSTRYQQVYSASAFAPINIGSISFFLGASSAGSLNSGTYSFYLSTTTAPVNGLSTTMDNNVGADAALFGVFQLTGGAAPSVLSFSGAPFQYNPANGNLLLDIRVSGLTHPTGGFAYYQGRHDAANTVTSRMHDFGLGAEHYGLVTEFTAASTVVPEPSTWVLMAAGLAGLAVVARRRTV